MKEFSNWLWKVIKVADEFFKKFQGGSMRKEEKQWEKIHGEGCWLAKGKKDVDGVYILLFLSFKNQQMAS